MFRLLFILFWLAPLVSFATNHYVALDGANNSPYLTWADAATNIQYAIDVCNAGGVVIVSNGVYNTGGTNAVGSTLTNRVFIHRAIVVQSANNDPTNTVIKGAFDPLTTNGPAAVRCVWITNGASLIGFTLTNGATSAIDTDSGGILGFSLYSWVVGSATASNCIIAGNSCGGGNGSGARTIKLYNCLVIGNQGATACRSCTLYDCDVMSNSTSLAAPAGIIDSTMYRGSLIGNVGSVGGGGRGGSIINGKIKGNRSSWGGGVYDSVLYNCEVIGNQCQYQGGGVSGGTLYNCTVVGNWTSRGTPTDLGGGLYNSTAYNSIIYSNSTAAGIITSNDCSGSTLYYSCSPYAPASNGNITTVPQFNAWGTGYGTNHVADPTYYRELLSSPTVNHGQSGSWLTSYPTDLDGLSRVRGGRADMGAYEYQLDARIYMAGGRISMTYGTNLFWDVQIQTTNANAYYAVGPTTANPLRVEWGDGSISNYTGSAQLGHYYANAGTYKMSISGVVAGITFLSDAANQGRLLQVLSPIRQINGLTIFTNAFYLCSSVTSMPLDMLADQTNITTLKSCFYQNSLLRTFPTVSNLTAVTNLSGAWLNASVTTNFPEVSTLTNVTDISATWFGARIARTFPVVNTLTKVTTLFGSWYYCTNGMDFPVVNTLTNVTSLYQTWYNCAAATNFPDVNTLTKVTTLYEAWRECSLTKNFPAIDALTNVTSLYRTWYGCTSATNFPVVNTLTKVDTLFQTWFNCPLAKSFPEVNTLTNVNTLRATWYGATVATNFPVVSALAKVDTLYQTWLGATSATSFPEVNTLTNVTTLWSTWQNCSAAKEFPSVSAMTNVLSLFYTWASCTGMTNIPVVFTNNPNLITLDNAFSGNIRMGGSAVQFWNTNNFPNILTKVNCYLNCTNLSDYGTIPASYGGTNLVVPQ